MQSLCNQAIDLIESYAVRKGLLLEKSKTTCAIFGKHSDSDVILYNGKKVPEADIFRHLGIRLEAKSDFLSYDAHWSYLKSRFGLASRQVYGLLSLSYRHMLANKYRSTAYGVYLHGADCSPLPKPSQLRPLQSAYCKMLQKIFHEKFQDVEYPSQREVLAAAGHPSLFNAHIKAKLTRISSILKTGKP